MKNTKIEYCLLDITVIAMPHVPDSSKYRLTPIAKVSATLRDNDMHWNKTCSRLFSLSIFLSLSRFYQTWIKMA